MQKALLQTGLAFLAAVPAVAAEFDKPRATGLAHILELAEKCQYKVDADKLATYFKSEGFDRPEALAWINHKRAIEAGLLDKVSVEDCAMAKTTAASASLLK